MKLVSWNINGLEDDYLDERTEAAMFHILLGAPIEVAMKAGFIPDTPDIVVLQEVVSRSFYAHLQPHFKAAGFTLYPDAPSERSYFEVIAVREKVLASSFTPFSYTQQGRGLTVVTLNGLTIMTSHLESQKPGSAMRIDQAQWILAQMEQHDEPCIFAGDTNLRDSEWQQCHPKQVVDAWETLGSPKKYTVTWLQDRYKARYDRVWCKGLTVKQFATFGRQKLATVNTRASDHLGIQIEFET